jgi:ribonuclease HI
LQLKPPDASNKDFLAWHYEKNGVFSVRSAYKLAYFLKYNQISKPSSSSREEGTRDLWKLIWNAPVPNKIRIFAWRVACDNLATKSNKFKRNLEIDCICKTCSCKDETSYHATVECTKAKALRQEMRNKWSIPDEDDFMYTGPDWLLLLLANISNDRRGLILMILWRSWHLRCDVIHSKGECKISDSVQYLDRYLHDLMLNCRKHDNEKGKQPISNAGTPIAACHASGISAGGRDTKECWKPPGHGWVKINVDASFTGEDGKSYMGCIARDSTGKVLWASCRGTGTCANAEEAEAIACLASLHMIPNLDNLSVVMESDNAAVVEAIKKRNQKLPCLWRTCDEIETFQARFSNFKVCKIRRGSNQVAHELAKLARYLLSITSGWGMSQKKLIVLFWMTL